ncbi:glycoside hydrolase family 128 protein [Phanerochaete sordida]|uniref:Glycoside hydrolase family 128 protein n=1 Tax=Phanerochaete sordida TaxID=48140 RepID=A0A9P3FY22_9APHY|nr:glycoside hydrolase family 128 protein [Phanerochaete sordida]
MASKLINLLALTTLAVLATTFTATPVAALEVTGHQNVNRQVHHDVIARRSRFNNKKRQDASTKRCKPRPSTSLSSSAAPTSTPVTSVAAASFAAASPSASTSESHSSSASHTSSSAAAASSTPASTTSDGSGKLGLAWPNGPTTDLQFYATNAAGWVYSWSPYTPDPNHQYPNLQFMAQLWGDDQVTDFESVVKAGYANYILGMNEPNESGQSNMTPEHGADLWKQHIEPKRSMGYKTCSPATSSNPNGFTWVANMLQACNGGCTFDCIAIHWYDVKADDFKAYATKWHDTYNMDIFITEFAPQNFNGGAQPSTGDVWAFYQEVMPWIMSTPWIKGAFPFGFMHDMSNVIAADQLMGTDGKPTDLGYYLLGGNY